jgi:hypothetical protein
MPEMLKPTSAIMGAGLWCRFTDGDSPVVHGFAVGQP